MKKLVILLLIGCGPVKGVHREVDTNGRTVRETFIVGKQGAYGYAMKGDTVIRTRDSFIIKRKQ